MATKRNSKGADGPSIRVRMYRVGFGDCFLVSLPSGDGLAHILVDCGVHVHGDIHTLDQVVANIVDETRRKLAVIIATHAHRDHIYGFGKYAAEFRRFEIGEVWLPWTESNKDKGAARLRRKRLALVAKLAEHFAALAPADQRRFSLAMDAVANMAGNDAALTELRTGFDTGAEPRYLEQGMELKNPANIHGLNVKVLGPPRDEEFLGRLDPPAGQKYLTAGANGGGGLSPFTAAWDYTPLAADPQLARADLKTINQYADSPLDRLAFALNNVLNNTSVVTLFSFRGRNLLFPGDAQYGNWQAWLDKGDGGEILSQVNFYKVSHHGSENATPVEAVEKMSGGELAVMVPTQKQPFPTIPRLPLLAALDKQAKHKVIRSDSLAVQGAPKGPQLQKLPPGFAQGALWFDCQIGV